MPFQLESSKTQRPSTRGRTYLPGFPLGLVYTYSEKVTFKLNAMALVLLMLFQCHGSSRSVLSATNPKKVLYPQLQWLACSKVLEVTPTFKVRQVTRSSKLHTYPFKLRLLIKMQIVTQWQNILSQNGSLFRLCVFMYFNESLNLCHFRGEALLLNIQRAKRVCSLFFK